MSQLGDIEAAVLAAAAGAIAGLTVTQDVIGDARVGSAVPHAYLAAGGAAEDARGSFRQVEREVGVSVRLVSDAAGADFRDDVEAVRTALYADPTLGGLVEDLAVAIAIDEYPDKSRRGAIVSVVTRVSE